MLAAQQEYKLNRLEKQFLSYHLVVIDELSYVPFSKTGAELLFQFCSARHERGSLIITTNLNSKVDGGVARRTVDAQHCWIGSPISPYPKHQWRSYRFKQALARQTTD